MKARLLTATAGLCCLVAFLGSDAEAGKKKKPAAQIQPANTVQGSAFGVYYDLDVLGQPLTRDPTPLVTLAPAGGTSAQTQIQIQEPGIIDAPTITVVTSGTVGPTHATADSFAIIEGLGLLDGLITANAVVSFSSSFGDGTIARSESNGSGLIGLGIAGVDLGNIVPPPNTALPIPGVGVIIINEQVASGDGVKTTALTVNAAHVILLPELEDPTLLEQLLADGVIDIEVLRDLLGGSVLDLELLQELQLLGLVDNGLISLVTTVLGGTVSLELLESLMGTDLIADLLETGNLDLLLEEFLPGGLLNIEVLEALLESGELGPALEAALSALGVLDSGALDLTFLEGLVETGTLTLQQILDFVNQSEFDLSLPEGELILSQAVSGVQFFGPTAAAGTSFLMHGGGQVAAGAGHAHFGIHVHVPKKKKKGLHGKLHYHDHAANLHVHSHTISSATVDPISRSVTFSGIASVNGVDGFAFTATAQDVARHGRGNDLFSLSLEGPAGQLSNGGTLTAGSLHLHLGK